MCQEFCYGLGTFYTSSSSLAGEQPTNGHRQAACPRTGGDAGAGRTGPRGHPMAPLQGRDLGVEGAGAGLAERMRCRAGTAEGGQAGQRSSRRRHGIITTLRLASPAAVTAGEGSAVPRCRCHSEGTVSACRYSLPIGASKATDSCGTRVERDGEAMRSRFGGSRRWTSGQSDPVSFSCCSHTISCQEGGSPSPPHQHWNNSELSTTGAQPLAGGGGGGEGRAALAERTPLAPQT